MMLQADPGLTLMLVGLAVLAAVLLTYRALIGRRDQVDTARYQADVDALLRAAPRDAGERQ